MSRSPSRGSCVAPSGVQRRRPTGCGRRRAYSPAAAPAGPAASSAYRPPASWRSRNASGESANGGADAHGEVGVAACGRVVGAGSPRSRQGVGDGRGGQGDPLAVGDVDPSRSRARGRRGRRLDARRRDRRGGVSAGSKLSPSAWPTPDGDRPRRARARRRRRHEGGAGGPGTGAGHRRSVGTSPVCACPGHSRVTRRAGQTRSNRPLVADPLTPRSPVRLSRSGRARPARRARRTRRSRRPAGSTSRWVTDR